MGAFCKLDDLVRYCLLDVVAAALDLQGDADQAEGDTEDAHALWVELARSPLRLPMPAPGIAASRIRS
jgi:hypothetical protein